MCFFSKAKNRLNTRLLRYEAPNNTSSLFKVTAKEFSLSEKQIDDKFPFVKTNFGQVCAAVGSILKIDPTWFLQKKIAIYLVAEMVIGFGRYFQDDIFTPTFVTDNKKTLMLLLRLYRIRCIIQEKDFNHPYSINTVRRYQATFDQVLSDPQTEIKKVLGVLDAMNDYSESAMQIREQLDIISKEIKTLDLGKKNTKPTVRQHRRAEVATDGRCAITGTRLDATNSEADHINAKCVFSKSDLVLVDRDINRQKGAVTPKLIGELTKKKESDLDKVVDSLKEEVFEDDEIVYQLADAYGVLVTTVIAKLYSAGARWKRPPKKWSPEEDQVLTDHADLEPNGETIRSIVEVLRSRGYERPIAAVKTRLNKVRRGIDPGLFLVRSKKT